MQKLETRDTYTPTDASQVRGNCDCVLNREQHPSVHSLKTVSNSSDENRPVSYGSGTELESPCCKNHTPIHPPVETGGLLAKR